MSLRSLSHAPRMFPSGKGVETLPMKVMQEQMSSGPGYYEGALYDIARQHRGVPAVPMVLVRVEP